MLEDLDQYNLLKNRKVIEEINRHLWLESEKAGYDIGFEKAAEDWLIKFSTAWMEYHMPEQFRQHFSKTASPKKFKKQK